MAQQEKCMLCKLEDLGSNPCTYPTARWAWRRACDPSTHRRQSWGLPEQAGYETSWTSEL